MFFVFLKLDSELQSYFVTNLINFDVDVLPTSPSHGNFSLNTNANQSLFFSVGSGCLPFSNTTFFHRMSHL